MYRMTSNADKLHSSRSLCVVRMNLSIVPLHAFITLLSECQGLLTVIKSTHLPQIRIKTYLRSICRLLSSPSSQLCPIPWWVTMLAMLLWYVMENCCNIHDKSPPSILMAVRSGFDLCLKQL